jgi:hypothetical protein
MKTRLLVFALVSATFGIGVALPQAPAYGCSCAIVTVDEAIRPDTPAAFIGTAVAVADNPDAGFGGEGYVPPRMWTFEVETVLAGELPEIIQVGSGSDGADCGYDFAAVGRVGVVTYGEPGSLTTGICGGVWGADELLAAYGPGTDPIPIAATPIVDSIGGGPPAWFWPVLAGGALALAGVGVASTRRRRDSHQDGWGRRPGGD